MHDDDIDIERAAHDPDYRRKVIAQLNRDSSEPAASADSPEKAAKITLD